MIPLAVLLYYDFMSEKKQTPKIEKDDGLSGLTVKNIQPRPKTVNRRADMEEEIGGYEHKAEPTRYGDWETNGRCTDF